MEQDVQKMQESIDIIAKNTAYILEKMATKNDIGELKADIHDFRMEVKSFKSETEDSIKELEEDLEDLTDTDLLHDKRIEKLENKFI
jgi:hypothetical protein